MTKLVLVTCLYDLTKHGATGHRTIDGMFANSGFVMDLDVHLVVFTEPEWRDEILKRRAGRPTEVILRALDSLVDPVRIAATHGRIQDNATRSKVTPVYIQLMWAKYEMLRQVTERELHRRITMHDNATHIGWIDFGITHVAKTVPGLGAEMFCDPPELPRVHVLRAFDQTDTVLPNYWYNVHGHLAGGLVVGSTARMYALTYDFWKTVDDAINFGLAPLDEGVLSVVVAQNPTQFSYSYGDYCDILLNHDRPRDGAGHLRWQLQDAERRHGAVMDLHTKAMREALQRLEGPASADEKPLLGLVMILKNEAHGIEQTLASFKPFIDRWTILDTGSTDGTQALIKKTLDDVPGTLHEEPFVDFSTSRNRALELHGETTVFTLMPDADDYIVNGQMLRAVLAPLVPVTEQSAFLVNIRRGALSYYLPILLRTAARWRYRYRVHEVCGPEQGEGYATIKIPQTQIHQRRPEQSHEASKRRWERDLALLRADYIADPREPRILFYLAQTYECLSRPVEALHVYDERIAVGGWGEETYEAKLRRAKILEHLLRRSEDSKIVRDAAEMRACVPWADVQQAYLDLYAENPARAEPLFQVAQYWHDKGKHPLAYTFAQRAAATPMPNEGLFIDASVYEWRAAYVASISGFYCDQLRDPTVRENARRFAEKCVRYSPGNENYRANWAFYAPSAAQMFDGFTDKRIDITPEDPYVANNPSVYYDSGAGWRCLVRTTNYRIINGQYLTLNERGEQVPIADNPINTRNFMLALDNDLNTVTARELIDCTGIPRSSYPVHGFEDGRLFRWNDQFYFTCTVCDFDLERPADGPREIVLCTVTDRQINRAVPLRGPWSKHSQKNWMPIAISDGAAHPIVYATSPTGGRQATVFDLAADGQITQRTNDGFLGHGRLRGGSQVVPVPSHGYLAIVHDVAWTGDHARIYLHRFVQLNADFQLVAMTDPFHFKKLGIEFCAGLAYDGQGTLVASFGVEDREPWFGMFSLKSVLAALRKDYQI